MSGSRPPRRSSAFRRRSGVRSALPAGFGPFFLASLRSLAASWPTPVRHSFRRYLASPARSGLLGPLGPSPDVHKPYWLLLPCWIAAGRGSSESARAGQPFLRDVLAAQYYLFLGIRARDDAFDGQWRDRSIEDAAGRLIAEAERILVPHFGPRDPFWKEFRRALRNTGRGIELTDRLQRTTRSRPARLLRAYSLVNSVFCIAPAAVCLRTRRRGDLGRAKRFSDLYSAGAQILDDLQDVGEDLQSGRLNYAAAAALASSGTSPRNPPAMASSEPVARGLIEGLAGIRMLETAARQIGASFDALRLLRSGAAREYERRCLGSLGRLRAKMLHATIEAARGQARFPRTGRTRS